jgi:hypothetical protein
MIFTRLLFDHLRATLGTDAVNAALAGDVGLFVSAAGANAVAAGAGSGFVAAAAATATLPSAASKPTATSTAALTTAALAASAAKTLIVHFLYLLVFVRSAAWLVRSRLGQAALQRAKLRF